MGDSRSFFNIGIAAPNLMVICIDGANGVNEPGRLYSCYSREPDRFEDQYQLLLLMEQVMEKINYPQSSVALRQYGKKEGKKEPVAYAMRERPAKVMEQTELLEYRGGQATYAVRVQYRQNATWQGELVWLEHNEARSFTSELEMLKLIDSLRDE